MHQNFSGPSFTVGIEEELMIVDGATYALVNAIEALLQDSDAHNAEGNAGEVKPELMESVLEIATKPCATAIEAGDQPRAYAAMARHAVAYRDEISRHHQVGDQPA